MQCVTALIDSKALLHNINTIKSHAKNSKIVAVVKANAYGHGAVRLVRILEDYVDALAVARISEALELVENGYNKKPIILLEGFFSPEDVNLISKYGFYTGIHEIEQVRSIEESSVADNSLNVWVQVDIGMHRLGSCDANTISEIKSRLEKCSSVKKPLGLISHLSVADTPSEEDYNLQQIKNFKNIAQDFTGDICLSNSAGIFRWKESQTPWVRPGIVMYGISPFADSDGTALGLKPVMTLKSRLISIHKIKKGDKVGYGAYYVAPKDTTLGIVACGYGDGYPRTAPNGTPVLINGRLVKTAGHVCMDMLFVDLGADSQDSIGDEVTLWGEGLPVERIASLCNTIPYELVCHVMPRVVFEYR
ncbi:MAG: alanine racemase [Succinivibrio sp.]